jgi:hypothetical protein
MLDGHPGVHDRNAGQVGNGHGGGAFWSGDFQRARGWRRQESRKEWCMDGLDGKEALGKLGQGVGQQLSSKPASARKICANALKELPWGATEQLGDGAGNLVGLDGGEERLKLDDGVHEGL